MYLCVLKPARVFKQSGGVFDGYRARQNMDAKIEILKVARRGFAITAVEIHVSEWERNVASGQKKHPCMLGNLVGIFVFLLSRLPNRRLIFKIGSSCFG